MSAPDQIATGPVDASQTIPGHAKLALTGIGKVFGRPGSMEHMEVLKGINLTIAEGEFVSIVGPSGCGKSTILKMISGLTLPSCGSIRLDGHLLQGTPKGVGFMFQGDALLPWATVAENILVGIELGQCPREQRAARLTELIELVGLEKFADFYPAALSGGMRQRVSLARTIAYEPSIFLMDEPFGALDAQTKIILGREFLRIWSLYRRTVLFVTHDIGEAITLSDRIVVMSPRPGGIVAEFEVAIPRPRDFVKVHGSERFASLYADVWNALTLGEESPELQRTQAQPTPIHHVRRDS